MIVERGAQLAINGDLTNDHIRPWPIDIHDGLAGSRADHHEADVFLGTEWPDFEASMSSAHPFAQAVVEVRKKQ